MDFHIHISKMTSKSQYEKNLDAFAPYYYDDENHIDSLTTTTAAEGLRNCFFLIQIKYKWLLPLKGLQTLAKPKFKNCWKIKIR